jgi:hypothetical protein
LGGAAGPGGLGPSEWLIIGVISLCCCGLLVAAVGGIAYVVMRRRQPQM